MRLRSVDSILSEIDRYEDHMIEIVDDCFTIDRVRAVAFCKRAPKLKYCLLALTNGTIAKTLTEEMIEELAAARLTNLMIGQESVDREVIRLAKRNIYPEDCGRVIGWCKKKNITAGVFMIIGLSGSSYESDREGVKWVRRQNVLSNYGVAIPFRNTSLWDWVEENGRWLTDPCDYEDYPLRLETQDYKWADRQKVFKYAVETPSSNSLIRIS